jgi:hypothetical protein
VSPSVGQTEVCLVLRHKPRNHRGVLSPNQKTVAAGFEVQTRKSSTNFVLRLNQENIATDFEAKPEKIITTSFEAKLEKTVLVVLRSNH